MTENATHELIPYGTINFDAMTPMTFRRHVIETLQAEDELDVEQHEPTDELVIYERRPLEE